MNRITAFTLSIIISLSTTAQTNNGPVKPLTIGEIRTIHSSILNEDRVLNIYLPGAFDKEKAYPVIYALDGSMNEDFLHITGLVQFFNLQFAMPEFIIVGIANVDRKRDFTFYTDNEKLKKDYPTTGHSDVFIQFLEKELQPFIQSAYKTTETKYLIGQSLGGLLATEILLKKPELFSYYFIISPSLWWDNESLLENAATFLKANFKDDDEKYVYISAGAQEAKIMQKDANKIYDILRNANYKKLKTDFLLMQNENHATILHRSLYEGFLRLYPYKK